MAVQLAGCEPAVMAEAAKLNADRGARIIDINFGCPVKKVVNGHAGSALMRDEVHAARILEATVKSGESAGHVEDAHRLGRSAAQRAAARAHCRSMRHPHDHACTAARAASSMPAAADWKFIRWSRRRFLSRSSPTATSSASTTPHRALQESGADGLMIGRGCYGRPWFVRQVIDWLKSRRRVPDPPLEVQRDIVLGHYEDMLTHYGTEVGSRIARKHVAWYSKGLPGSAEFRAAVNQTADVARVRHLDSILLRAAPGSASGMIRSPLRRRSYAPAPTMKPQSDRCSSTGRGGRIGGSGPSR